MVQPALAAIRSALARSSSSGRIVVGEEIEVEAVGGADRLLALRGVVAGLGVFADDARLKEAAGVLEIATRSSALSRGPTTRT